MISAHNQVKANAEAQEVLTVEQKKAATEVFESILFNFLSQLEAIDPNLTNKLRQTVRTQVSLSLSSLVERQRLNSWIMGYTDNLQVGISINDMQHCIHHAYMSACDNFGPNRADVILSKAVKYSEALPAAKEFAPRNLL